MADSVHFEKKPDLLRYLQIVVLVVLILFLGKTLFIPLFFGLFIAIVLYPVCKALEQKRFPKAFAIFVCLLIITVIIAALIMLLILEIKAFSVDFPQLQKRMNDSIVPLQEWVWNHFGISTSKQAVWMDNTIISFTNNATSFLQGTLTATFDTLFILFMVPVFTSLFLYNRNTFIGFLKVLVGAKYEHQLNSILRVTIQAYHKYIRGMILVYLVVGVLNSVGLLALGVKHAFLFGMLTAIMTIVPYIGIVVSAMLPISVAWITTGTIWTPLGVITVFSIVQYLEANIIFPLIVGAELNVNTWSTLVAVIAGGIIWGVSGMVLFMPFIAVLKIISDHVEEWKPLNVLLSRSG